MIRAYDAAIEREVDREVHLWEEHFRSEDARADAAGLPRPWHPHVGREYLRAEILRQRSRDGAVK